MRFESQGIASSIIMDFIGEMSDESILWVIDHHKNESSHYKYTLAFLIIFMLLQSCFVLEILEIMLQSEKQYMIWVPITKISCTSLKTHSNLKGVSYSQ